MNNQITSYNLPAAQVPYHFVIDGAIYRVLANGALKEIRALEGGRLSVVFNNERLAAVDIAWARHYGNWPRYPLVQVDGDPFNLDIDNIMPARFKRLRYRQTVVGGIYRHPLQAKHMPGFTTARACRSNWVTHAREYYLADLPFVLAQEKLERDSGPPVVLPPHDAELTADRRVAARAARVRVATVKPPRPSLIEGMEWHWMRNVWISIPVAVHVGDDWRERLRKYQAGAVRFEFNPMFEEVWGYDAAGAVVR